jgi:hypothetical protein
MESCFGCFDACACRQCPGPLYRAAAVVCARAGGPLPPWVSLPPKSPKNTTFYTHTSAAVVPKGGDGPRREPRSTPTPLGRGPGPRRRAQAPSGQTNVLSL